MFLLGNRKSYQAVLMVAATALVVGCTKQTVETESLPPPPPPPPPVVKPPPPPPKPAGMTEEERRRRRDAFRNSMSQFENSLVYFDFDKSEIRPDMRPILDAKARFLQEFETIRLQVEGHCDERGTVEYNIALGHRRSQSAKEYLVSLGVDPSRIDTVSYGEERPEDARSNEEAWAKNRRAKFNIIGGVPAEMN